MSIPADQNIPLNFGDIQLNKSVDGRHVVALFWYKEKPHVLGYQKQAAPKFILRMRARRSNLIEQFKNEELIQRAHGVSQFSAHTNLTRKQKIANELAKKRSKK